jgi:hypothetical protein
MRKTATIADLYVYCSAVGDGRHPKPGTQRELATGCRRRVVHVKDLAVRHAATLKGVAIPASNALACCGNTWENQRDYQYGEQGWPKPELVRTRKNILLMEPPTCGRPAPDCAVDNWRTAGETQLSHNKQAVYPMNLTR